MKKKLVRRLVMLLAVTIFMTQVSYFPAKAAEGSAEEAAAADSGLEAERETEVESVIGTEAQIRPETESAPEAVTETNIVTETESVAETEDITETDIVPETVTEAETEITTEVEAQDQTETEITEEQIEDSDKSLSGISFRFSDLRDSEETDSEVLNTDDGKQAVYVFGSFTTCSNTGAAVKLLSKCVEYYDKSKINIYVFDNSYKKPQELSTWLTDNKISQDIAAGSIPYYGNPANLNAKDFYDTCLEKTVGYGGFTMPIIVYKGTNGEIYTHTTGYQTEAKICANIEAGGLSKITGSEEENGEEKDGLLYVTSGLKYNMAYEILDIVNAEREKQGLPALVMDKDLLDAAMQRAVECEVYYASDHTRPNGEKCFTASEKMNGENIAWGYGSASQVMNAWMNSQGHRENILRAEFHSIGIGVADAGGRLAFTQCFGVGQAEELQKPSDISAKTFEIRYIKSRITPALTQNSVNLVQGGTHTIVIRTLNAPVSNYIESIMGNSYRWKSSDETVATVDEFGTVKGIKAGKATIIGTNVLNKAHTLTLEVTVEEKKPNVSSITLNKTSLQLKENETFQLTADVKADVTIEKVEWKCSDESVATVNEDGLVTAKSAGSAVITATSYGKQATCNVKVVGTTLPPTANIPTNTEVGKGTLITLTSDTPGAVIYYTTDNSEPTTKSKIYKDEIAINEDTTIKAYASSKDNEDSPVVTFNYTLRSYTVSFDTDGGSTIESLKVYQNDTVDEPNQPVKEDYNFAGWYLDGKPYDFSTPVTADLTLKAVWKEYDALAVPVASLKSEMEVEAGTRIALSHLMSGVTIYYTTDGKVPTIESTEYKNAIVVNNEITIRAIAVKEGYKNSEVADFHYTVAEKGSLWGDVAPEDIPNTGDIPKGIWVKGIEDVTYTGKAVTHDIRVYDGNTLLVEKKDYTVSYKNNKNAAKATDAKAPTVIINGKGNYNDKKVISFNINPKNIGDSDVTADEITLAYTGKTKKVVPTMTYKQKKLSNNKDFTITNPSDYSEAKKYTINVEGKGNYTGTRNITLTVTRKTLISKASVTKIQNQTYDGKAKTPAVTVKLKKELVLNQDYTLSYEDNKEIGTAAVIIKGKGEYAGTKRVTFKIVSPYKGGKYDIGKDEENLIDVDIDSTVIFLKGGCTPAIRVSYNGKRLSQGKDYTVSFKDNKAAYAVSGKDATAIISGKGSYCGKITKTFRIETKDLSNAILLVNDKVYTGKAKGHVTKFTLTDTDGKAIKAGSDYEKEVLYTYANSTELENGESRAAGDTVKDTDIVPVGTTITVTVRGKGSYENSITGEYRIIAKENDISKAKITLKTPQYYTGSAVEPDENQFEVKLGEKTLKANEYKIVGYTNNVKKGNAAVTIRGEGTYGGTKTAKFVIGSKTVGAMEIK